MVVRSRQCGSLLARTTQLQKISFVHFSRSFPCEMDVCASLCRLYKTNLPRICSLLCIVSTCKKPLLFTVCVSSRAAEASYGIHRHSPNSIRNGNRVCVCVCVCVCVRE